ncbi:CvpA family protein [Arenibacter sp. GZD96]|uniref:CvpA family protein n=1 Tax=Aurantibrevibacter litoralis TaxID=3106030 RepID=UPI002AFF4A07|nr:CvpA family protein [Arenibacter sp. GZD-96]MEA1786552.1 CvpA family protein [Arenibacter sp. GZD-96]
MNVVDIIIGLLLLYGLFKGLSNGLFVEIASLVALIAGLYGAIHFSYITGDYLSNTMQWDYAYMNLSAFIITFILIVIVVSLAGKLLTKIADFAMLGLLNKIAGSLFGILKVAVLLGAVLIFMERSNRRLDFVPQETLQASKLYKPIKAIGALVFSKVLRGDFEEREQE